MSTPKYQVKQLLRRAKLQKFRRRESNSGAVVERQ